MARDAFRRVIAGTLLSLFVFATPAHASGTGSGTYALMTTSSACLPGYHRATLYGGEEVLARFAGRRVTVHQEVSYAGCAQPGSGAATAMPASRYWSTRALSTPTADCPAAFAKVTVYTPERVEVDVRDKPHPEMRTVGYRACERLVPTTQCTSAQISETVATNATTYTPGQTVFTVTTSTNLGVACFSSLFPNDCGAEYSAWNASGQEVWDSLAIPNSPYPASVGCPGPEQLALAPGGSTTTSVSWSQVQCVTDPASTAGSASNPNCPETQVPDGSYTIETPAGAPVDTITIAG